MPPMPPQMPQGQQGLLGPSPQMPTGGDPSQGQQSSQQGDPSQMLMELAQHLKISPQQFRNPGDFLTAILKAAPMPQVAMAVDAMAKKLGIPSPAAAMQQPQGQQQSQSMPQQGQPSGLLG